MRICQVHPPIAGVGAPCLPPGEGGRRQYKKQLLPWFAVYPLVRTGNLTYNRTEGEMMGKTNAIRLVEQGRIPYREAFLSI